MNNKKIIIMLIFILLLIISIVSFLFLKRLKVEYSEVSVIQYDKVTTNLCIKSIKNGKLEKEEIINTSDLGNKEIDIVIKDFFGFKHKKTCSVVVNKPEKKDNYLETEEITYTIGDKKELKDLIKVSNTNYKIEGKYSLEKEGTYTVKLVFNDESEEELKINVIKKKVEVNENDEYVEFTTSKGFQGYTKNGVTYIDGILIANKTYSIPSSYGNGLTSVTTNAFSEMQSAATLDGMNIYISSGFRSYATQTKLYNNYVNASGKTEADTYSARPGHSEHQTGLAFDVNIINETFASTPEAKWLNENAYKYGFILRYPKGKEDITGYIYESWHFRYVGEELASKLYNDGDWITLEEYFGITSEYDY